MLATLLYDVVVEVSKGLLDGCVLGGQFLLQTETL